MTPDSESSYFEYLRSKMGNVIVTRKVLEIYDKYHGDFGLMDEPWGHGDREEVSPEQMILLSDFVDHLEWLKTDPPYVKMREESLQRIEEIEKVMDPKVAEILRKRILGL